MKRWRSRSRSRSKSRERGFSRFGPPEPPPELAPRPPPPEPGPSHPGPAPAPGPVTRDRDGNPVRPPNTFLTDGKGVVYRAIVGLLVYIGFTTLSLAGRKQELQDPASDQCPKWVRLMHKKALGTALGISEVFVVTSESRRIGRMRELLATLFELRKAGGPWRARGGPWCDARTEGLALTPVSTQRWNDDCRLALDACLVALPADLDGSEPELPQHVRGTLEVLALRFACIARHLDNTMNT
jgi:hypothetical protein